LYLQYEFSEGEHHKDEIHGPYISGTEHDRALWVTYPVELSHLEPCGDQGHQEHDPDEVGETADNVTEDSVRVWKRRVYMWKQRVYTWKGRVYMWKGRVCMSSTHIYTLSFHTCTPSPSTHVYQS